MYQIRDYRRQLWTLESLAVDFEHYAITRFETHEIGKHVQVIREYVPTHCVGVSYHESMIVGPRGGIANRVQSMNYGGRNHAV